MTTPAPGSGSPDADQQLHLTRSEKFSLLREVTALTRFSRRGRHADVFSFIEKIELHTLRDGFCHLRQQDISASLRWGADKLREVRNEAAALGWCEVIEGCPTCGDKKTLSIRINWPKIAATARRKRPGHAPDKPASQAEKPASKPEKSGRHNKEVIPNYPRYEPNDVSSPDEAWPKVITKEDLRSDDWLQRHYELRQRLFNLVETDTSPLEFWSCAEQSLLKGKPPGKLFTGMLKKPRSERFISDGVEQEAQRRLNAWKRTRQRNQTSPIVKETARSFGKPSDSDQKKADAWKQKFEKHRALQEKHAGAAGPGVSCVPSEGSTDVDVASVGSGESAVNPTTEQWTTT